MGYLAIIQARIGSTRLPGKVLLDLCGKTVLERVVERVEICSEVDEILVATTVSRRDLPIVAVCASRGIRVFCGSEDDVLDRYYQSARLLGASEVLRITADCPLIDPDIMTLIARSRRESNADYASNTLVDSFPDGLDVEALSFGALERAWTESQLASEREHVTPYIKKHPELFHLKSVVSEIDYHEKRWTVDDPADYAFVKAIYAGLGNVQFGMPEVLNYLASHPELETLNAGTIRNAGYLKSVANDRPDNADLT